MSDAPAPPLKWYQISLLGLILVVVIANVIAYWAFRQIAAERQIALEHGKIAERANANAEAAMRTADKASLLAERSMADAEQQRELVGIERANGQEMVRVAETWRLQAEQYAKELETIREAQNVEEIRGRPGSFLIVFSGWQRMAVMDEAGKALHFNTEKQLATWLRTREDRLGTCWILAPKGASVVGLKALLDKSGVERVVPVEMSDNKPGRGNSHQPEAPSP